MARGTQHRKRRPTANAAVASATPASLRRKKKPKPPAWQDQLFFNRLRNHTKWVFLLLAVFFAVGFVVFGVGSGSTGISSAMQSLFNSTASTGGGSVSSLKKKTVEQPKNAQAWRNLATKYETDGDQDDAITALTQYTALKPKDQNGLTELAGLYLSRATALETSYEDDQSYSSAIAPSSLFQAKTSSKLSTAITSITNPITSAVSTLTSTQTNDDYSKLLGYLSDRLDVYKKIVALNPKDASSQYSLGQAAQSTGDSKTAIKAYKAFLVLAPQDALAKTAKAQIKSLGGSVKK